MPILRISMLNVSPRSFETVEYAVLAEQHVKLRLAPDVWVKVYVCAPWRDGMKCSLYHWGGLDILFELADLSDYQLC